MLVSRDAILRKGIMVFWITRPSMVTSIYFCSEFVRISSQRIEQLPKSHSIEDTGTLWGSNHTWENTKSRGPSLMSTSETKRSFKQVSTVKSPLSFKSDLRSGLSATSFHLRWKDLHSARVKVKAKHIWKVLSPTQSNSFGFSQSWIHVECVGFFYKKGQIKVCILDSILGPSHLVSHTLQCPCFSVVLEATHEASRGPLKCGVSDQKTLQWSETETMELLGGMEEKRFPDEGSLICPP